MARPKKNNAQYFPHYTELRNHRKVKALRNKFGSVLGYAFWCMILEWLTEQDGLEWKYSEIETEIFASELGVSAAEIPQMIDFCIRIELLFLNENNCIYSNSLNECLKPVFDKRENEREKSKSKKRSDGKFIVSNRNVPPCGVSAAEIPDIPSVSATEKPQSIDIITNRNNNIFVDVPPETSPDPKIPKNSLKETFKNRENEFKLSLYQFTKYDQNPNGLYDKELVENFFNYWREPNKSKTKMKWEVEKTWDLDLRLKRWSSNNFNTKPTAVFTSTVKIDHRNRQ